MKKFIVSILAVAMVMGLAGCSAATNNNSTTQAPEKETTMTETTVAPSEDTTAANAEETLGQKLSGIFMAEVAANTELEEIANKLSEAAELDCMVVPAAEGYLNGFSDEIKGFTNAYQFSPMIGAIAFVGYVFETDDADALMSTLTALADPRWNVCTEAAETVCVNANNYVFFTMCPGEDEYIEE